MRTTILFLSLSAALVLRAQPAFPTLSGVTANGRQVSLPSNNRPWTVIGMAFSQKASPLLDAWYEPAYLRFIAKHGLLAASYEAEVFFIPLFVGTNKAAFEPSIKRFRESADPDIVDHVLFSKDAFEPLKAALDLKDKDIPYFFVLDAAGRIVHREQGAFTDEKLDSLEEVMLE